MRQVVSKDTYLRVIANRPFKLDAEEVNYRESEGEERCEGCMHFYTMKLSGWNVCEIFRDVKKKAEYPIDPEYVCDFWTSDGESFPLLKE